MAGEVKLTKSMREGLEWFEKNGPTSLFGVNDPSSVIRKRLLKAGLIETCGVERGASAFSFVKYRISAAGRRAYAQGIEDAEKACEKVQRVLREPTREESRALADAGYMPLSEYVRLFGEK
jgi:hypothetical protein